MTSINEYNTRSLKEYSPRMTFSLVDKYHFSFLWPKHGLTNNLLLPTNVTSTMRKEGHKALLRVQEWEKVKSSRKYQDKFNSSWLHDPGRDPLGSETSLYVYITAFAGGYIGVPESLPKPVKRRSLEVLDQTPVVGRTRVFQRDACPNP